MKFEYRELMDRISVPENLPHRVLQAVRQETGSGVAFPRRRSRPALRAAVCMACALALALSAVRLTVRPEDAGDVSPALLPQLADTFGLTAYAAELDTVLRPNANGGLALLSGSGLQDPQQGQFTGCLFQVTGEHIQKVTLFVDRGGLYRSEMRTELSQEEEQALAAGELVCTLSGTSEDGPLDAEVMTVLGSEATVEEDPSVRYGFWLPAEAVPESTGDLKQDFWNGIDYFDGAHLTVEVTFTDGTSQSKTYTLSAGRLRTEQTADGTWTVLPQLAGEQTDDTPFVYGIYAASETESRWLRWPVQDRSAISLSNPFGARQTAGGQEETVHDGVDIPAEPGDAVLAAADGTVTETGVDPVLGRYVRLDHGGGLTTLYAACQAVEVEPGDTVRAGARIAAAGSTGMSTGTHLHFEVRQDGKAQNPVVYFDAGVRETLRME